MSENQVSEVLRRLPYGFYIITSRHGDDVNAMVLNWLTQVSFEPRMIAIGLQKKSYTHKLIEKGRVFAVNVFNKEDIELLKPYTKGRDKNPDKMKAAKYTDGPQTGSPLLDGAAAHLECRVVAIHDDGGDHNIVVAEVIGADVQKPGDVNDSLTLRDLGWSYAG
jgi:flavin reductase (DIM6/NTAB) family NADH-FMN oxidoreductase RutF